MYMVLLSPGYFDAAPASFKNVSTPDLAMLLGPRLPSVTLGETAAAEERRGNGKQLQLQFHGLVEGNGGRFCYPLPV